MKKKIKDEKTLEWSVDEYWQVTNGKLHFRIDDVKFLSLGETDLSLKIIFAGFCNDIIFKDDISRQKIWKYLIDIKRDFWESNRKQQERNTSISQASLGIQAKMLGHHIK